MKLFVVTYLIGGYAREDSAEANCAGVFTEKATADKVKMVVHGTVSEIELDYMHPGFAQTLKELGIR